MRRLLWEVRQYLNGRWVRKEVEAPYAFWGIGIRGMIVLMYIAWGSLVFGREFEAKVVAVGRDGGGVVRRCSGCVWSERMAVICGTGCRGVTRSRGERVCNYVF